MKLIKGGKNGQCLLYSLAMLLDESPDSLIKELGHDGLTKVWPELPEPYCYNTYHIQEIIDLLVNRGQTLYEIEAMPTSTPHPLVLIKNKIKKVNPHFLFNNIPAAALRIYRHLKGKQAILIGETSKSVPHAVAWDGTKIFDSRGKTYSLSVDDRNCDFQIQSAFIRTYL